MTVRLTFQQESQRATAAWFIAGSDPAVWLEEIALWNTTAESLRLHVVSGTDQDSGSILGVLVTGCISPTVRQRAVAWACVSDRLFVPVESAFDPPVTDRELGSLLPGESDVCVWHPQAGLIRFESDDLLTVSDLLTLGELRETRWDLAEPGIAFAERLVAVTADAIPSADDVFGQSRDDIGSEGGQLDDLPPAPGESSPGAITKATQGVAKFAANAMRRLAAAAPGGASAPTWIDRMDQWASGVLNRLQLDSERMRELQRLLSMLDSDPDRGLRKALPFGDCGSHRGEATPGNQLGDRDVDFSLGRDSSSGRADYWNVPYEIQQQLVIKYRELADRELRLGRYRRAAYIYGELLGDLHAAAQALEQGGFYLEAASLYQDRLSQPKEAAECLERGGLLHQAAELYAELLEYEDAARLYEQLEQPDTARSFWKLAIDQRLDAGDHIRAAELAREKLDDSELALSLLDSAWQRGSRSGRDCLAEWFRLTGELGRHDSANERLMDLRAQPVRAGLILSVLAETHASYPDQNVRHECADVSRVLVSSRLSVAATSEQEALVKGLTQFDRHDRLLKRDCNRFLTQRESARTRPPTKSVRKAGGIDLYFQEQLPRTPTWLAAASTTRGLYVAGYNRPSQKLELRLLKWVDNTPAQPHWDLSWDISVWDNDVPLVLPDPTERGPVVLHLSPSHVLHQRGVRDPRPGLQTTFIARFHKGVTLTAASDQSGAVWRLATDHTGVWIESIDRKSTHVIGTTNLTAELNPRLEELLAGPTAVTPDPAYQCRVSHGYCFISHGDAVFVLNPRAETVRTLRFESPVLDMAVSVHNTRRRLAVSTTDGTYMVYDSFRHGTPKRIGVDLAGARLGMSKGGILAAVDGRRCVLLHTSTSKVRELEWTDAMPIVAVVPTPRPNAVATVSMDGRIRGLAWE